VNAGPGAYGAITSINTHYPQRQNQAALRLTFQREIPWAPKETADLSTTLRFGRDDKSVCTAQRSSHGENCRSLGFAPQDFLWNLVVLTDFMRLSLRERRTRDLLQCSMAGNPGRDDKGKGNGSIESGCWTEAFFITLDGPPAHDNSGRDDKFVAMQNALFPRQIISNFVPLSMEVSPFPLSSRLPRRAVGAADLPAAS
jgi:hypothetical protein